MLTNIKEFGNISVIDNNIIDSIIIKKDREKQELIINWIKEKTNKDSINFKKIFTMSLNGSSSKDFHDYCDNKGPTLTLIKTTKNKIFGGFTPLDWDISGHNKYDEKEQTFIFSLNLVKQYDIINKEKTAICCRHDYGPIFGGSDFNIASNMKKGNNFANSKTSFITNNNLELIGEEGSSKEIDIEDFEVFKVKY